MDIFKKVRYFKDNEKYSINVLQYYEGEGIHSLRLSEQYK